MDRLHLNLPEVASNSAMHIGFLLFLVAKLSDIT